MANTAKVNINKPTVSAANTDVPIRGSKYGEQLQVPLSDSRQALADEGSYYVVSNQTPGTGLATTATASAVLDVSPYFMLLNNDAAGGKNVYLDYLKLICTVSGAAATSVRYTVKVDNGVGRYTSGSSLTALPQNVNMNSSGVTVCLAYAGPLVAAAATAAVRVLGSGAFRTGVPVIGDTYILNFGTPGIGVGSGVATINNVIFNHPPVIIGPQQTFLLHLWLPAQSVASNYEIEVGWWER